MQEKKSNKKVKAVEFKTYVFKNHPSYIMDDDGTLYVFHKLRTYWNSEGKKGKLSKQKKQVITRW